MEALRTTPIDPALTYRSLPLKPLLTMLLIGLVVIAFAYLLAGAFHWISLLALGLSGGAYVLLFRMDPYLFAIIHRYYQQAGLYDPWPHVRVKRNKRPQGFAEDRLC